MSAANDADFLLPPTILTPTALEQVSDPRARDVRMVYRRCKAAKQGKAAACNGVLTTRFRFELRLLRHTAGDPASDKDKAIRHDSTCVRLGFGSTSATTHSFNRSVKPLVVTGPHRTDAREVVLAQVLRNDIWKSRKLKRGLSQVPASDFTWVVTGLPKSSMPLPNAVVWSTEEVHVQLHLSNTLQMALAATASD